MKKSNLRVKIEEMKKKGYKILQVNNKKEKKK